MKKIVLLIVVIVSFSCSKSEDEVINYTPTSLYGTWKLTEKFENAYTDSLQVDFEPVNYTHKITFLSVDNFTSINQNVNDSGKFYVSNDSLLSFLDNQNELKSKYGFTIVNDTILNLGPFGFCGVGESFYRFKKVSE